MIISQTATVTFPSGSTIKVDFQPESGITAVVGPNGSGKTFSTIELTRFLLFGKKAFRGAATDYKRLEAKGKYVIKGLTYDIVRGRKKEEITDANGVVLAVGADAVTAKVEEFMGYGLAVFDIANAAVQKQTDIFGKMIPSLRRKLIDHVVGITSYQVVEKACLDEGKMLKREVEALMRTLVSPVEPVAPLGYEPSALLSEKLNELRTLQQNADVVANRIRPAFEPELPAVKRPTLEIIETLDANQENFRTFMQEKGRLNGIMQRAMRLPKYTEQQLAEAEDKLTHGSPTTCPKCQHTFTSDGHAYNADALDLSASEIAAERLGHRMRKEFDEAASSLARLSEVQNRQTELDDALKADAAWARYDAGMIHAEEQLKINHKAEKQLREIGNVPGQDAIDELNEAYIEAKLFEATKERYDADKSAFEKLSADISSKQEMAEEYRKGAVALADARATLKAHLAPSLSRVASVLIQEMTGGKLSDVTVDEDMEITVNGQRIETLSGGGETVANIALRIALGQVLVSETFPVFFGDEMDGDADGVRREAILESMQNLKGRLKQIILITHKGVEQADHVVDLTE